MSYLEDAAAELAKVRAANGELRNRARGLRARRPCTEPDEAAAAEMEAAAAGTSFRLAEAYTALAALERDAAEEEPDDDAVTCSACGSLAGIFQGRQGWLHYRPGPPVRIYDAGHEVTLPAVTPDPEERVLMTDAGTEIHANVSVWHIRAAGMKLTPNEKTPQLLRLDICEDVRIVLDRDAADTAGQAAAMRELARLAAEAAEDLERAAAGKAPGDG